MKPIFIIFFVFIIVTISFGQTNSYGIKTTAQSFPTNVLDGSDKELSSYEGKVIAFDGIIEKIETSGKNTPLYKLKITNENYLWTILMFKNDSNKIGDKVRILGYLRTNKQNKESYLVGKYMVIAYGLIDFLGSKFLFIDGAVQQKQEWIDGRVPRGN